MRGVRTRLCTAASCSNRRRNRMSSAYSGLITFTATRSGLPSAGRAR